MDSLIENHAALRRGPAFVVRPQRALLEVSGRDRAAWLHNLTTNQVKTLQQGEGNYAFALNVQGRILFDLNMLVRPESIWVDLDRDFLPTARKHFEKYTITEDVKIADRSDEFVHVALVGEGAKTLLSMLGAPHAATLPSLGTAQVSLAGVDITVARTDFCGPFAVDLFIPARAADPVRAHILGAGNVVPVGPDAVEVHRIEAGIPWPGREITDEYLPAETGQISRAVSFQKGCYLGQEVVERMRSRGVVARKLRGLWIEGDSVPSAGASVADASEKVVGVVTSSCHSLALGRPIAMAYIKTAAAAPNEAVRVSWESSSAEATVAELPFTQGPAD